MYLFVFLLLTTAHGIQCLNTNDVSVTSVLDTSLLRPQDAVFLYWNCPLGTNVTSMLQDNEPVFHLVRPLDSNSTTLTTYVRMRDAVGDTTTVRLISSTCSPVDCHLAIVGHPTDLLIHRSATTDVDSESVISALFIVTNPTLLVASFFSTSIFVLFVYNTTKQLFHV